MKKILPLTILLMALCSCKTYEVAQDDKAIINKILDDWHKAAAEANFDAYFAPMAEESIFIGTDPTENWNKEAFKTYSKPHFDKGKAWSFTAIERNIFISEDKKTAWFDELLDTQMKICRGSGVLVKAGGEWKIAHYVLSISIPNDNVDEVVKIKSALDDKISTDIKAKK